MQVEKNKIDFLQVKAKLADLEPLKYFGSELNKVDKTLKLDNNKVYTVYREAEDLFNKQTIESFEGVSVTLTHPNSSKISAENWKNEAIGHAQNIRQEGNFLVGDIFLKDATAIQTIRDLELKDISLGYTSKLIYKDNKLFQTDIEGNHVSIVADGRAKQAQILNDGGHMEEKIEEILATLTEIKTKQDEQEQELKDIKEKLNKEEETINDAEDNGEEEVKEKTIEELKAENEELRKENEELKEELKKLKNENSIAEAINDAMSQNPYLKKENFKQFKSDAEIRAYAQGLRNANKNTLKKQILNDNASKRVDFTRQFGGKK